MRRASILGLLVLGLAANACAAPPPDEPGILRIPVTDAAGRVTRMAARVCRPAEVAGPARLVVINHGSPPDGEDRPKTTLGRCDSEPARWFLARGYVVVYALRRGYGATDGDWAEGFGGCPAADFAAGGRETARDIHAIVAFGTALPGVRPDEAVVVGQSAGAWGTIAYDSLPHPKVAAMIAMAGGRGGHLHDIPGNNCRPDALAAAAGTYGRTASTPMLWIYAANDSYFNPAIAHALHAAFTGAGGMAQLETPGPFGHDGHFLFSGRGGSAVWGPMVAAYLARQNAD